MRTLIFVCSFLLMATLAMAQDCFLKVINNTTHYINAGAETTTAGYGSCATVTGSATHGAPIAPGESVLIYLGTAVFPAPPIRPYRIGADDWAGGMASWQINTCWNPTCINSFGPFTIMLIAPCNDYVTEVSIN